MLLTSLNMNNGKRRRKYVPNFALHDNKCKILKKCYIPVALLCYIGDEVWTLLYHLSA